MPYQTMGSTPVFLRFRLTTMTAAARMTTTAMRAIFFMIPFSLG